MALGDFISKMVVSITKTTLQFNKTLDVLISQFKDSCPSTQELKNLIQQKNEINGALVQIEQKIATLNKVSKSSEVVVKGVKAGVTIIKQLPIPTSFPPGVGIPVSIINNFSDALDNLGTLIDKEEGSLSAVPQALDAISSDVGTVITKLNELNVLLNSCLEKDPNITQDDLNSIVATTGNFVGIMTDEELEKLLSNPPGLLYGDYYLRLIELPSDFSFVKKQVTAQNKESVPPPGEYYKEGAAVEMLYGDESFSSSNIVLVDEMKWLIDTKDLTFPPPPPAEDPLKAIQRESQVAILVAIYGANVEEAEELYELAWELSQNEGPNKGYYDTLVVNAFDSSRTVLEQAVANEGYEFKDGDRVLNATIKRLFLGNVTDENIIKSVTSQLRNKGKTLLQKANQIGGSYNSDGKRWDNDGFDFEQAGLYLYAERLANTARVYYDNLPSEFASLKDEIRTRKREWQAIYNVASMLSVNNPYISFTDPLKDYFKEKGFGYNVPIINTIEIEGDGSTLITSTEIENIFDMELVFAETYMTDNWDYEQDPWTTPDGVNTNNLKAYAKNRLFIKMKDVLGLGWYNKNATAASLLPFWSVDGNPNSSSSYFSDANYGIDSSNKWFFEFGKNSLPIPTDS